MSEELARDALRAYGVPADVLGAWDDRTHPLSSFSWAKPDFEIARNLAGLVPGLAGLSPLFEENGEAVIGILPSGVFVRYYYEDGPEGDAAIEVLGENYQQFAAFVLVSGEEAGASDEYQMLVDLLRFSQGPELRRLFDRDPYDEAALQEFLSRL